MVEVRHGLMRSVSRFDQRVWRIRKVVRVIIEIMVLQHFLTVLHELILMDGRLWSGTLCSLFQFVSFLEVVGRLKVGAPLAHFTSLAFLARWTSFIFARHKGSPTLSRFRSYTVEFLGRQSVLDPYHIWDSFFREFWNLWICHSCGHDVSILSSLLNCSFF